MFSPRLLSPADGSPTTTVKYISRDIFIQGNPNFDDDDDESIRQDILNDQAMVQSDSKLSAEEMSEIYETFYNISHGKGRALIPHMTTEEEYNEYDRDEGEELLR